MGMGKCKKRGFTIIELIVVIAIMSVMAGMIMPMTSALITGKKVEDVEKELERLADALEAYYFEHGSFPSSLTASGFYGVYIVPGVNDDWLKDEWGSKTYYKISSSSNPDIITVYSVGENGVDDGAATETYKITIYGAGPGNRRTRQKLDIINARLAVFLAGGGTLSGDWDTDRQSLGLGTAYRTDGFGTPFHSDPNGNEVRSAGADRTFNTVDDLTQ